MEIAPQQVNLNLFRQERPLAVKPKQDGHSTENESVKIPIISLLTCARTRALQEFLCFLLSQVSHTTPYLSHPQTIKPVI